MWCSVYHTEERHGKQDWASFVPSLPYVLAEALSSSLSLDMNNAWLNEVLWIRLSDSQRMFNTKIFLVGRRMGNTWSTTSNRCKVFSSKVLSPDHQAAFDATIATTGHQEVSSIVEQEFWSRSTSGYCGQGASKTASASKLSPSSFGKPSFSLHIQNMKAMCC